MKQFLNKYIYITVKTELRLMVHKCALVTNITDTHISILDDYDNEPYFYPIADVKEAKISKSIPKEVKDDKAI